MNVKKRIEEECLIAFIHSRLTGLGKANNVDTTKAFEDKRLSEKAQYAGNKYSKILEKVSSFDKIQKKLAQNRSFQVCEWYYISYKSLEKIFDKHCPIGSEVIEGQIGMNLLALYLEYWSNPRIKIDYVKQSSATNLYEKATSKEVHRNMLTIATKVYTDYAKQTGQKYQ